MSHFVEQTYEPTGETYQAFVPTPIGADFEFDQQTIEQFAELDQLIKTIQSSGFEGINRYLTRFSAGGTSLRDGRSVSRKRLALINAEVPRMDLDARFVLMHSEATEEAVKIGTDIDTFTIDSFPKIAEPLKNDKGTAGKYRKGAGWIGGENPTNAYYVCPPVEEVEPLMQHLCDFLNRDDIPASLQAAVVNVQYCIIHPMSDGNGRTSRALVEIILRRRGIVTTIAPPLFLHRLVLDDNEYVEAIKEFENDKHQLLYKFWFKANRWAIETAKNLQGYKQDFIQHSQAQLDKVGLGDNQQLQQVVTQLFSQPIVTPDLIAKWQNCTVDNAKMLLANLTQAGVCVSHKLREPKDLAIWDAPKVFELISEFDQKLFTIEN